MTALDQAFIKAFSRQETFPLAVSPPVAASEEAEREASKSQISNLKSKISSPKSQISNLQILAPHPTVSDGVWAALERPPKGAASPPRPKKSEERAAKHEELPEGGRRKTEDEAPKEKDEVSSVECLPFTVERSSNPQSPIPNPFLPPSPFPLPPCPTAPVPAEREFKPAYEVDHFTWPRLCRRLIARAAEELDRLADALLAANNQGRKVLAIAGCRRGEGATTLLLCAARRLAERGIKPLLVDADLGRPRLAKRLGVQPEIGWDETTEEEGHRVDQAIVEASANNVALLPVREPADDGSRPAGDLSRLAACLKTVQNHYDTVLVDLGPLEDVGLTDGTWSKTIGGMIDAVVLVHNDRITSEEERTALVGQLAAEGITVAGIVENFVTEE